MQKSLSVTKIVLPTEPDEGSIKTTFKGYDNGIYALATRKSEYISITSTNFEDNKRGIYLSSIDNAVITENEFLVRDKYSKHASATALIGLYLDASSTGFTVEENTFYTNIHYNYLTTEKCNGITVNNSGQQHNELYNNVFKNLTLGIAAGGENRDTIGAGLCVKCNDFSSCITDVYVCPEEYPAGTPLTGPTIGIAVNQGSKNDTLPINPTLGAGNTFSKLDTINFFNDTSCNSIVYAHHKEASTSSRIIPLISSEVTLDQDPFADYDKDISCPSNIVQSRNPIIDKSVLDAENIKIAAYNDTLIMVTDGGDTEQLNLDVITSFPNQAMELKQQLLDESPYLSDKVMKSAIGKENVLPNVMIRDVLLANPQSAKSPHILQSLYDRNTAMPNYMMLQIMQGQNTMGDKERIESELAKHKTNYTKARIKIEKYYQSDTINQAASIDSLVNLWNSQPYSECRYKLAFHYLELKDSVTLFSTLANIPVEFDLTLEEEEIHEQYASLFDVLWQTRECNIGLDSSYIQALVNVAENYRTLPGAYAMNALIQAGVYVYDEPVYFPDYFKSRNIFEEKFPNTKLENMLRVFPNPAGTYFIVKHDLRYQEGEFVVIVSDMHGRPIDRFTLDSNQNEVVFSAIDYTSGFYIVHLQVNGVLKAVEKLSISR